MDTCVTVEMVSPEETVNRILMNVGTNLSAITTGNVTILSVITPVVVLMDFMEDIVKRKPTNVHPPLVTTVDCATIHITGINVFALRDGQVSCVKPTLMNVSRVICVIMEGHA